MLRYICSVAFLVWFALAALADVGPPRPYPGCMLSKHVIKLDQEIPGYRFFLFHGTNDKDIRVDRELKLSTKKALVIPDTDTPPLKRGVIALPLKLADELKTKENVAKLCAGDGYTKRPPGVVVRWYRGFFGHPDRFTHRTTIVMLITVYPDSQNGVKFSTWETSAPLTMEQLPEPFATRYIASESTPLPRFATVFIGIALTVAIVTEGLWFYRKKLNSR